MGLKFILTGHYAGKTVTFNHCEFVNGEYTAKGDVTKLGGLVNYLASFNAYPEGSDALKAAQARDAADTKENANGAVENLGGERKDTGGLSTDKSGSGKSGGENANDPDAKVGLRGTSAKDGVSAGREGGESSESKSNALLDAVKALDPTVDDNWTEAGLPKVEAVAAAAGLPTVTRKEIEAAAPGWNRDKVLESVV